MSYLNDVYYCDPNTAKLFRLTNDAVMSGYPVLTGRGPSSILVATNKVDVYVANTTDGTVNLYNNGVLQKTIKIGAQPSCMCEDNKGNIYVSNYQSRTVSKITNGVVKTHIYVGNGPKGLCSNANGEIYVCLYLENRVVKISNDILLPVSIPVGRMPNSIRCDKSNNLWVACTFSNTVVKISKDMKVKDITVGSQPYDIVIDQAGDKWVSNFGANTVSKITGDVATMKIPVGQKPYAMACNGNEIYVFNSGENTIYKINAAKVVAKITTCYSPQGFGDPTGYQGYFVHQYNKVPSGGGGGLTTVSYADLDADMKARIDAATSGGITLPIVDDDVNHAHPKYDTVKKALDFLLYVEPKVSISNSVGTVEKGTVISNVDLNFTVNKDMQTVTIDHGIGNVKGLTSKKLTGQNISTDTTFTITATDAEGKSAKASTTIKFLDSVYYGASTAATITDSALIGMGSKLASNKAMSATINCSGGKYIYIAMPASFGLTKNNFKIGGLANSAWTVTTMDVTNSHGHRASYTVFRSDNLQNGSAIKVDIA